MTHSPEPWKFNERHGIFAADSHMVTGSYSDVRSNEVPNDEDCERIVACVNFCREFETEWLKTRTMRFIASGSEVRTAGDIEGFDGFVAVQMVPVATNDGVKRS